jgi:hypothetical protein
MAGTSLDLISSSVLQPNTWVAHNGLIVPDWILQPNSGAGIVDLVDEYDAGLLKSALDLCQRLSIRVRAVFETAHSVGR